MAAGNSIPAFPPDTDRDAFGNWLSGLIDGEGCFKLVWHRTQGKTKRFVTPGGRLEISLRADDYEALSLAWSFWRVGCLFVRPRTDRANPAVRLIIASTPELVSTIIPHFHRYPLRAKKRADFAIWEQGILLLHQVHIRPRIGRTDGIKGMYPKWTDSEREQFDSVFRQLQAVRAYSSNPVPSHANGFTLLPQVSP